MKVSHITFFLLLLRIYNLQKLLVLVSCSHFKSNTYSDTMLALFLSYLQYTIQFMKKNFIKVIYQPRTLTSCKFVPILSKWLFIEKIFFSEHFNKNQLIYPFKIKIVEQNKMIVKIWVYLILKLHQYETNDFYIKNSKNFFIQYWFRRETGFARKLVWHENWFGTETGLVRKLVSQGNLLKFLLLYLWWDKLLIIQKLVTLQFCDFWKN